MNQRVRDVDVLCGEVFFASGCTARRHWWRLLAATTRENSRLRCWSFTRNGSQPDTAVTSHAIPLITVIIVFVFNDSLLLRLRYPTMSAKALCIRAVRPSHSSVRLSVRLSRQILLAWYLVNAFNNFDKINRELSLAHMDDLIILEVNGQRSRSQQAVEMAKTFTSTLWRRSPIV